MRRRVALALAVALVFACSTALILKMVPEPHAEADYLIAGTLATFATLVILFGVLAGFSRDIFFRRRPR